ncbi:MAG: maleylacetoacetate isomerase [Bdellovibrionales bacterium]|nr:maleylacetoacetate isomerase [Bdellovibrionales bacterium]
MSPSEKKIILHGYFRSSATYRVRIGLNYKNIPYDTHAVHLLKDGGEQLKAAHRDLNPMGEVPVLVIDGKPYGQSMAILQLLEDLHPEPRLFGKSFQEKAKIIQLCENVNAGIHPLQNLKVLTYLEKNLGFDQGKKEVWSRHWISLGLSALNQEAEKNKGPYMMGATLSAADLYLIPQLFNARRFQMDLSPYSALTKVEESCLKLDCFIEAHPHRQEDTPPELKEA